MELIFWLCLTTVVYAYFGYVLLLWTIAQFRPQAISRKAVAETVSIIIAARNEAANIQTKLDNLSKLEYPREKLQIVIVSDGSTDRTPGILADHSSEIFPVILDQASGKACALNEAVRHATGDILVFQDARQTIDSNAVMELISCFADPSVGAVSGELLLTSSPDSPADALGLYWKIEKIIRRLESESGSVVGVTGAIYAIRRELYRDIPAGTILDNVFVPMQIARLGRRVVFQSTAIVRDRIFTTKGKEFARKIRTLTGNYQLLTLAPWLISPQNPLLFRFISHKVLRLLLPLPLVLMLITSGLARGSFYRLAFGLQVLFYCFALIGSFVPAAKRFKPVAIATTFVMLNAAATLAFYNFIAGNKDVWISSAST